MARRKTVWVLWARTWNNGGVKLYRVTSKKVYQSYHEKMKGWLALQAKKGFATGEDMPTYFQESTDKELLMQVMKLAQPLATKT